MNVFSLKFLLLASLASAGPALYKRQAGPPPAGILNFDKVENYSFSDGTNRGSYDCGTAEYGSQMCNQDANCQLFTFASGKCQFYQYTDKPHFNPTAGTTLYIKKKPEREYVLLEKTDANNPDGKYTIKRFDLLPIFCEFLCNFDSNCKMISYNVNGVSETTGCWTMSMPAEGMAGMSFKQMSTRNFKILKSSGSITAKSYLKYPNFHIDDSMSFGETKFTELNDEGQVRKKCEEHCGFFNECAAFYHERATKTCRFFKKDFSNDHVKAVDQSQQRDLYLHQYKPGMGYIEIKGLEFAGGLIGTVSIDVGEKTDPIAICSSHCDNMPVCNGFAYLGDGKCQLTGTLDKPSKKDTSTFYLSVAQPQTPAAA